jgi:hypothetical protein
MRTRKGPFTGSIPVVFRPTALLPDIRTERIRCRRRRAIRSPDPRQEAPPRARLGKWRCVQHGGVWPTGRHIPWVNRPSSCGLALLAVMLLCTLARHPLPLALTIPVPISFPVPFTLTHSSILLTVPHRLARHCPWGRWRRRWQRRGCRRSVRQAFLRRLFGEKENLVSAYYA